MDEILDECLCSSGDGSLFVIIGEGQAATSLSDHRSRALAGVVSELELPTLGKLSANIRLQLCRPFGFYTSWAALALYKLLWLSSQGGSACKWASHGWSRWRSFLLDEVGLTEHHVMNRARSQAPQPSDNPWSRTAAPWPNSAASPHMPSWLFRRDGARRTSGGACGPRATEIMCRASCSPCFALPLRVRPNRCGSGARGIAAATPRAMPCASHGRHRQCMHVALVSVSACVRLAVALVASVGLSCARSHCWLKLRLTLVGPLFGGLPARRVWFSGARRLAAGCIMLVLCAPLRSLVVAFVGVLPATACLLQGVCRWGLRKCMLVLACVSTFSSFGYRAARAQAMLLVLT